MVDGPNRGVVKDNISAVHPLQLAIAKHEEKQQEIVMRISRSNQGLHAPLRLMMERNAVKDIGHLPCLHRHNALLDALTGRDVDLEFEDVLNDAQNSEYMSQPHVMVEKYLGIM
nr:EOG090X0J8E [Cyclestheria hislopi]